MKRIEVIIRVTDENSHSHEKVVMEWIDQNHLEPLRDDILRYPGLEIHLEHCRVFKNGQEIFLSRYEYGVLRLLATNPGKLFTKEQIFAQVWYENSSSYLTAVTNAIGRIRLKIEDDRNSPQYIRTISNLGYQFMPQISRDEILCS